MSPMYEFQRVKDGARVEEHFPMREAPECGTVVRLPKHGRCRRIASGQRVTCFDPRHVAYGFPRKDARSIAEHPEVADYPHTDADGYAAFSSMREIREFQAKHPRYAYDVR